VRRPPRSVALRTRIALLCAVGVGVAGALAALASFFVVRNELTRQNDRALIAQAKGVATDSGTGGSPALSEEIGGLSPAELRAADVQVILLVSAGSTYRYFSSPGASQLVLGPSELAVAQGRSRQSLRTVELDGIDFRVAAVPAGTGAAVVLARSLADQEDLLSRLAATSTAIGGMAVVLAGAAGYSVARAGLAPVARLTAAAERVARTTELVPIPVPAGPADGEVVRLAIAFNAMLAALAAGRESERRLVADAGHELRTPLTSMRTNLDLLLQAEQSAAEPDGPRLDPADRADLLADLHAQTGELSDLVGDLVELSRGGLRESGAARVDLAAVVTRAAERARRRGPDIGLTVVTSPFDVLADPAALERAVVNVLDNAIRWTPPGGTVALLQNGGVITVDDTGPGFAPQDLPYVFDRFYRAPAARAMPGSGLGLAIVAQVTARHGGTVVAGRAPTGGARITIVLPPAPQAGGAG
jgi:two-component system sensor histidine kinase MprB